MSKGKMILVAGAALLAVSGSVAGLVDRSKRKADPKLLNLKMLKMALAKFIDTFEVVDSDVKDRRAKEKKESFFENRYLDKDAIQKSYNEESTLQTLHSRFFNNKFSVDEKKELKHFFGNYMEHNPKKNLSSSIINYVFNALIDNIDVTYDLYTISREIKPKSVSLAKQLNLIDLDTKFPKTNILRLKVNTPLEQLIFIKNPVESKELLPISYFLNANQAFSKIEELLYFLERCNAKKATIEISESLKSSLDILFNITSHKKSKEKEDSKHSKANNTDFKFSQNSEIEEKSRNLYEVTWNKANKLLNQEDKRQILKNLRHLNSDDNLAFFINSLLEGNQLKGFKREADIDLENIIKLNVSAQLFAKYSLIQQLSQTAEVNLNKANNQKTSFKLKVEFY